MQSRNGRYLLLRLYRSSIKRALDIAGACVGLLIAWPLMVVVAICIRWKMGPPVLFRQRRPGLHERSFVLLKFRTMREERETGTLAISDAARLTPLGEFLRKASFDELPQLYNILRGEMSFIGPRPLLEEYLPYYTTEEHRRHDVRPGLTGWAQIHGRNELGADARLSMDVWYADNLSAWLDLTILWWTLSRVLRMEGVQKDPGASAPSFKEQRCKS